MNFLRKVLQNFLTLHHLSSRCNISTAVTPNQTRSKPMETRYPYLSRHTKFEETKACKCLQKIARRSDQNREKNEIGKLGEEVEDTW